LEFRGFTSPITQNQYLNFQGRKEFGESGVFTGPGMKQYL